MNILLTSVGRRTYLVEYFKEALKDRGEIHVSNSTSLSPAFLKADHYVVTPLIYSKEYIPFLLDYCKNNKISALISLFDADLPVLAKNREKFSEIGTRVLVSSERVISICNDKWNAFQYMSANGFVVPQTFLSTENAKAAISAQKIIYPVFVKPRWGMGSIGIYQANSAIELEVLFQKVKEKISTTYLCYESKQSIAEDVIIQEMINGQEYGLDIINDLDGNYQNTIVKRKLAMRAGETDSAETVEDVRLLEVGKCISEHLKHIGNLDVDIIVQNGKPYILEMNARFGGGYPFSHAAGVNLPAAIIAWLENRPVPTSILQPIIGIRAQKDIVITQI